MPNQEAMKGEAPAPIAEIDAAIAHLRGEMAKWAEAKSWGYVDVCNIQIRKLVETRNLLRPERGSR